MSKGKNLLAPDEMEEVKRTEEKTSQKKRYSRIRKKLEIEIEEEDGTVKTYTLQEMSGTQRDKFMNKMSNRTKFDNKGNFLGFKDFDGFQSSLITLCLFDEDGKPVDEATIKLYPSSQQAGLFEDCQVLCALGKKGEEEAKNE